MTTNMSAPNECGHPIGYVNLLTGDCTTCAAAVAFFHEHAGWSYDPATETSDQGRERCARELAAAEQTATERGWRTVWEHDPDVMEDDADSIGMVERGEAVNLAVTLEDENGEHLASLGGIVVASVDDAYVRVVAAELAADALVAEATDAVSGDLVDFPR